MTWETRTSAPAAPQMTVDTDHQHNRLRELTRTSIVLRRGERRRHAQRVKDIDELIKRHGEAIDAVVDE
ncbi:MAG TPA: hypothetical protein VF533_03435 [Solirubrobacteraceae bacterium]|jgi:hypothetical protein